MCVGAGGWLELGGRNLDARLGEQRAADLPAPTLTTRHVRDTSNKDVLVIWPLAKQASAFRLSE